MLHSWGASLVEELGSETLRRLCVFSNTALVSAYVTRPDDPALQEMEVFHDALSDEYSGRADAEQRGMLPQNVHVFPGTDLSEVVTEGEPIEACPAMPIEDLRYLAKNALRG